MKYTNFTIRARNWSGGHFKVEVLSSATGGRMSEPEDAVCREEDVARILGTLGDTAQRASMAEGEVIDLGIALADILLTPKVRQMLGESLSAIPEGEGLRLLLMLDDSRIARLPWEYLYWDQGQGEKTSLDFLALNPRTPIVRHTAFPGGGASLTGDRPDKLDVFVGFASPTDASPLDLAKERGLIVEALQQEPRVHLREPVEHLVLEELEPACRGAHVFHYGGHGGYFEEEAVDDVISARARSQQAALVEDAQEESEAGDHQAVRGGGGSGQPVKDGVGVLFFEGTDGKRDLVKAHELGRLLRGAGVRVVVLAACKAAMIGAESVWAGIIPAMIRAGIPAAVGNQFNIIDKAAIAFSKRLYGAIAAGMPLEEAVARARLAISTTRPFEAKGKMYEARWDWGLPVLYLGSSDGILFREWTDDPAREKEREQIREGWRVFRQEVGAMSGEARIRGAAAKTVKGPVAVEQTIGMMGGSAQATGIKAGEVTEGASLEITQKVDEMSDNAELLGGEFDEL